MTDRGQSAPGEPGFERGHLLARFTELEEAEPGTRAQRVDGVLGRQNHGDEQHTGGQQRRAKGHGQPVTQLLRRLDRCLFGSGKLGVGSCHARKYPESW